MSAIPECAILDPPFKLEGTPLEQKKAFFGLARSRVYLNSREEHQWYQQQAIPDYNSPAVVIVALSDSISCAVDLSSGVSTKLGIVRSVNALYISIDRDLFMPNGEDFTDLIPLVIEHEIYEAWFRVKRGYQVSNSEQQHEIARRREWALATQLGKTERLLEFCKKFRPWLLEEFALASKRFK